MDAGRTLDVLEQSKRRAGISTRDLQSEYDQSVKRRNSSNQGTVITANHTSHMWVPSWDGIVWELIVRVRLCLNLAIVPDCSLIAPNSVSGCLPNHSSNNFFAGP